MKKLIISATVMAVIGGHNAAIAYCTDWGNFNQMNEDLSNCTDETGLYLDAWTDTACSTVDGVYTTLWYDDDGCHYIKSCKTCPSGYSLEFTDTGWTYNDFCYNPDREEELKDIALEVYVCKKDCVSCTNCTTTGWVAAGAGYQKSTVGDCQCDGTCKYTTNYQCAVGYYGRSTNGTTGCTRCPSSGGVYGTTANAGSTSITSCYIPANTAMTDGTGEYVFTSNCYYKN